MDIKNLLDNLHEEISCSVCMSTFTDPKQLPCLHSFCLHCLNGIQRTSGTLRKITCPECRKQFNIPESGNPSELPTNFRINRLVDVLAIKECKTLGVKCGNCDETKQRSFYCFQCCLFWCDECIISHNRIKANKKHRALALADFEDQDFENILKRPTFCQKKHHENEELKFFCKVCEVAVCNACVVIEHEGHAKMILEMAANETKIRLESEIKSLKNVAQEKKNDIEKINQDSIEVQVQVAEVKSKVQTSAEEIIAIAEAKKQYIINAVDKQANASLDSLALQKGQVESQLKEIESAIKQTETLLKQSSSAEILGLSKTFDTMLKEHGMQTKFDSKHIPRFRFIGNEKLLSLLNTEGIGNIKTAFSETKTLQLEPAKVEESSKAVAGVSGGNLPVGSFASQVQSVRFRQVLSFGVKGESVGKPFTPWGVAVNDRDEIAVTDVGNNRVSVFSSDGTHLRSFGRGGSNEGEFDGPRGIAFDKNGNIIVADSGNHRIQIFSGNGRFLGKFGKEGSFDHQLYFPEGLSVTSQGNIIVADKSNNLIKIFSPSLKCLRKIGTVGSLDRPYHCIQHGQYFIVSDYDEDAIKIFDHEGKFSVKFGKKGNMDGEFNGPCYLSVTKGGLVMVCDKGNQRVQVFDLNGNFVSKFECEDSRAGGYSSPTSAASLSDGRIVVCDIHNKLHIFERI